MSESSSKVSFQDKLEHLRQQSLELQKRGVAPLPVVRLCFVGRGRAGKTTIIRRLKGEPLPDDEQSTDVVDVWAHHAEVHLKTDSQVAGPWKEWEKSMHSTALKDALRLSPRARYLETRPNALPQEEEEEVFGPGEAAPLLPALAPSLPRRPLPQQPCLDIPGTITASADESEDVRPFPETCGPTLVDEETLTKILNSDESETGAIQVRLQCWDFSGQEEFAQLSQLCFSERAIYLVVFDLTGNMEQEWRHLSFWLWAIVRFSIEREVEPPILLLGTKAGEPRKLDESELQKRFEELQRKLPRLRAQLQARKPGPGKCTWLFPIENKAYNYEEFIRPLRSRLQQIALQFLTPRDIFEAGDESGGGVPGFVGLQAQPFPLSWLRAHDLLTRLGAGFRAKAPRSDVEKAVPDAEPGHRIQTTSNLRATISDKSWLIVPAGAYINLQSNERHLLEYQFDVLCDFLELSVIKQLLGGMQPVGLSEEDTEHVLSLLDSLGIVVWIDEPALRDLILLNPRCLVVAMERLLTACFGDRELTKDFENFDLWRFRSTGIATQNLIRETWKKDFPEESQQRLVQQVLLRSHLMFERLVAGECLLPSCLPVAHCAEAVFRTTDEVVYLNVGGIFSPIFFPALAQKIYSNNSLQNWRVGLPQVFRNRGEIHSSTCSIFISVFPVNPGSTSKSLLRVLVQGNNKKENYEVAQEVKRLLLRDILAFGPESEEEEIVDPGSFFGFELFPKDKKEAFEAALAITPCMNPRCGLACSHCRLHELLQERHVPDLNSDFRSIVQSLAFFQQHTRPAGSFRFKAMAYPCDIDLEEYLVIDAENRDEALKILCTKIQKAIIPFCENNAEVFFGGLKAGRSSTGKWLHWNQAEVMYGQKASVPLREALKVGHYTWTLKMDFFAKMRFVDDVAGKCNLPRFFAISHVLRAGCFHKVPPMQPITMEKDVLKALELNLCRFAGRQPNAIKLVKRMWERSAYLVHRGFDLDWHLQKLQMLKPLLCHWAAELSQIAGHVETLLEMMMFSSKLVEHACSDFPVLRQNLRSLHSRLLTVDGSEKPAAEYGCSRIEETMKYIPEKAPDCGEQNMFADIRKALHKVQLLLESCVETVLISELRSLKFPVAKRLGELWQFPSDHTPIAAVLSLGKHSIKAASWNVLNRNYYKHIEFDTQGLKGSGITTYHEHGTREIRIIEKIQEMLQKDFHILCLQECWPELLEQLKHALGGPGFEKIQTHYSGEERDKNQEVIVFDSKFLEMRHVHHHAAFRENYIKVVTEAHFGVDGMDPLRVVTTHMPDAPFGRAPAEFADCLASIVKGEKLPTVLLGDLSFPEKVIHPLLLDHDLEDVFFVPTPYPTSISQGSLLPKRSDSIAVINHQVESVKLRASVLEAYAILEGLADVVELLKSRTAEPFAPARYQSDKDQQPSFDFELPLPTELWHRRSLFERRGG